jgi:hypothetical protein
MMNEKLLKERLAILEGKVEITLELLKEIRNDLKENPSRLEFQDVRERVIKLENHVLATIIRTGIISGIFGILGGTFFSLITKLF